MSQNPGPFRPSSPQHGQNAPVAKPARGGGAAAWNVILLDDNEHSFEYVERMMQELFYASKERAKQIAEDVNANKRAVIMTTHREHAELKAEQIHSFGRDPLIMDSRGPMRSVGWLFSQIVEPVVE